MSGLSRSTLQWGASNMEGAAVQKIAELEDRGKTIEVNGRTFARVAFNPVIYVPRPDALSGKTLTGLVDYIKANREGVDFASCMLHVVDHTKVELVDSYEGDDAARTRYYQAKLDENLPVFRFDEFMPVEDFIIKIRALFQPGTDLDDVVAIVSRVVAQDEISAKDDGLSQTVQVKRGVSGALTSEVMTKGVYELRPYRTFREIEQPAARFILRLKGGDGVPRVALFDAEGGSWRYTAMQSVKSFLDSKDLEIPVFA
jgi:hypothetical protein